MKSNKEQLEKRGFLPMELNIDSYDLSLSEKLTLLKSDIPKNRSLAARLLKNEKDTEKIINDLILALANEKKLYPKIEISNTLVNYGKPSIKPLIKILGETGNNQHKTVPEKEFKKDNYPLPRDIASRILAHIGKNALAELLQILEKSNLKQKSEAIDAIGFICFYEKCKSPFELLKKCYLQNPDNELIKWKIIRAFSSFPKSQNFLEEEKRKLNNLRLQKEIDRSILMIKKRDQ